MHPLGRQPQVIPCAGVHHDIPRHLLLLRRHPHPLRPRRLLHPARDKGLGPGVDSTLLYKTENNILPRHRFGKRGADAEQ